MPSPALVRALAGVLRSVLPVVRRSDKVYVFRHSDVSHVLERADLFAVAPLYAEKMQETSGDFILGMDDKARYKPEAKVIYGAVLPEDMARVRELTRSLIRDALATKRRTGRIDAVADLTRIVPARMLGAFFGTPGPDETTIMRWMRTIFWHLFLNLENDPAVKETAEGSAAELRPYLAAVVAERRRAPQDDFVSRVVARTDNDDLVRRSVGGVIVGAVDTVSRAAVLAVEELLRRPAEREQVAALARADRVDLISGYAFEALRFNPHQQAIARRAVSATEINGTRIESGDEVYAVTLSASFDPRAVDRPNAFIPNRVSHSSYLFGHGMHECFGRRFASIMVPELVAALFQLPNLRSDSPIAMDGPFPNHMPLAFDLG